MRKQALEAVEIASQNYLSAKAQMENKREVLVDACRKAHASGISHGDIALRTPYTRQRISQFLSDQ